MELCKQENNMTTTFSWPEAGAGNFEKLQTDADDGVVDTLTHICTGLTILFSVLGVTANVLNVLVYWRQGFSETVNITFVALSLWDLTACFLSCLSLPCYFLEMYFPLPAVNMLSVQYVFLGYTRGLMYVLSTLDTVYLSIERCVCIMAPFKVKDMFTAPRVRLVNLTILIFGLVCYCPAWATQGLQLVFDPENNRTRLVLWLSSNRRDVDIFVDTFNGMALPVLAQFLITISAGFMIQGIKNSLKFRHQAVNLSKAESKSSTKNNITTVSSRNLKKGNNLAKKDLKLTKVVIFLAMIFFICNAPVFIVAFVRALLPELDVGKQHYKLYLLLYSVVYLSGLINATVNIIVYYTVSTKYREEMVILFPWMVSCHSSITIPIRGSP